jgi:hypothetical protein
MHIFRHIFLINCWWQNSSRWDIFLNNTSIFQQHILFSITNHMGCILLYLWKQDELWANAHLWYNVYKNQPSRQTGSRNLMGPITLPMIWGTYMKLVTKTIDDRNLIFGHKLHIRYAILSEAFLDPSDSYFLFADLVGFYTHWTYMHIFRHIFLSNYWWQNSDIWSQASYRYPISWLNHYTTDAITSRWDIFLNNTSIFQQHILFSITNHIGCILLYLWKQDELWANAHLWYNVYKNRIGICYFSGKHCLARNQDNVSEWGDMSIRGLLFQGASTIKIKLRMLV